MVQTAARAAKSQTLIDLSAELVRIVNENVRLGRSYAYPDKASRPSGDISELRTHEECPDSEATAPEPGRPDDVTRTSCRIRRLSSEAERRSLRTQAYQSREIYMRVTAGTDLRVGGPGQGADSHSV